MRQVALVALLALLAVPVGITATPSVDDCKNAPAPGCVPVSVPASPAPLPVGTPLPLGETYYVYAASATCAPSFGDICAGKPVTGAPLGVAGLVYQETNGLPGLQRRALITPTRVIPPDHAVLL